MSAYLDLPQWWRPMWIWYADDVEVGVDGVIDNKSGWMVFGLEYKKYGIERQRFF